MTPPILDISYSVGNEKIAKAFDLNPSESLINLFGCGWFEFVTGGIEALTASYIGEIIFGDNSIWKIITTGLRRAPKSHAIFLYVEIIVGFLDPLRRNVILKREQMEIKVGTITKWNDEKGFGFITPKSSRKQIFFHIHEFSREHKRPVEGLSVTYDKSTDSRGRNCALNVYPLKGHKKVTKANIQLLFAIIISITFLAIVGILVAKNKLPFIIFGAYIILSVVAFALYRNDKSAAEWDEWRTPESTLHLISIIGGWPGALIAQNKLRHKSKKLSFRVVFWATVIINCGVLSWLLTPDGATKLKILIENINIG
jgi:uncharacterized membrane protein YsdA (DUF1294 family)/cold shock CspA family protein